ncbi:MAG: hypothetical protein M3042_07910 [Actinomycetota bacterium]|nr:hypothetical protein [Actinomycetota bacterium]
MAPPWPPAGETSAIFTAGENDVPPSLEEKITWLKVTGGTPVQPGSTRLIRSAAT